MNRRAFLKQCGLALAGLTVAAPAMGQAAGTAKAERPVGRISAKKPNIVFILADDMGWGDVHAFNPASHIPTPVLDRLAREGVMFTDAHAGSAVCTPTRYSFITGRHAFRNKASRGQVIWGFHPNIIEKDRLTLPQMLQQAGYSTACIGKWNLGLGIGSTNGKPLNHPRMPTNADWDRPIVSGPLTVGFDTFYGLSGSLSMPPYIWIDNDRFVGRATEKMTVWRNTGWGVPGFDPVDALPRVTRRTAAYINGRKGNTQPFFLYMALPAPHAPIVPAPEFLGVTDIGPHGDYCYEIDVMVGRVMQALEAAGHAEDTLVVYTSDNGFWRVLGADKLEARGHFPSGGFRGYKAEIHEGGHRVPFIVRWPRAIRAGRISSETICINDFMATCADLLGINLPDNAAEDSLSFLAPLLDRPYTSPLHDCVIHHSRNGALAVRRGKWKFIEVPGDGCDGWKQRLPKGVKPGDMPRVQLYDMETDPHETKNLWDKYPEKVEEMKEILAKIRKEGRSVPHRK